MNKLRFYYGTMNSMKSATLLMKAYQFEQSGCKTILIKPSVDTRDKGMIKSRPLPNGRECININKDDNIEAKLYPLIKNIQEKIVIFVDEVQFLTAMQVYDLFNIVNNYPVDIFAYGLKLNYKNELFSASKQLLILADTVEEIKSMCKCGYKATTHLRYVDDKVVVNGNEVCVGDIEGKERYESVCQICWHRKVFES